MWHSVITTGIFVLSVVLWAATGYMWGRIHEMQKHQRSWEKVRKMIEEHEAKYDYVPKATASPYYIKNKKYDSNQ